MNSKLAHLLVCLYPRPWRERYSAELEALLQTGRGDLRASANVVWSALHDRVFPTPGLKIEQRQFQSWCVRAPWAMFGLAPLFLFGGAWFVALLILWSGWRLFLPGADTPFVPIYDMREFFYFNVGRSLYFGAPILVGWGIGLIAIRQRSKAVWPTVGLVLIALMGGMLMAVPVSGESGFSTGTPVPLFQIHGRAAISSSDVYTYDVAKDGKRFLVNRYVKPERVVPLTILLHAAARNPSF
jgi:hypothetical protein